MEQRSVPGKMMTLMLPASHTCSKNSTQRSPGLNLQGPEVGNGAMATSDSLEDEEEFQESHRPEGIQLKERQAGKAAFPNNQEKQLLLVSAFTSAR